MPRTRTIVLASAAVIMLAVAALIGLAPSKNARAARRAPALPRQVLAGRAITLPELLAGARGRPVVVAFWASWCENCAEDARDLEQFASSPSGRGRLVGIDESDPETAAALGFVHRYALTFPNLRDTEGIIGSEYVLPGLPVDFVVSPDGRIARMLLGPQSLAALQAASS